MKTVTIHEAKTQLSKLVEEASKGESFIIARAGKPVVKVTALRDSSPAAGLYGRADFRAARLRPNGSREIERIFGGGV